MRFTAFITLLVLATMVPWYVFLFGIFLYGLYWSDAYELVLLGLLVDAFFGVTTSIPVYTIGIFLTLLVLEWVKPRLLVYNAL